MRWKLLLTAVVAIGSISLSAVEGVKQTLADRFESLTGAQDSDAASSESAAVVEGRHPEEIQQHEAAVPGESHHPEHKIVATCPQVRDLTLTERYVCQIHSRRHIEVQALNEGYLQEVHVNEGQHVHQGDLMFGIVPTLYQASLDSDLAEAQLAQVEYDNTSKLARQGVVSVQELKLAEAKLAKAQANVERSRAELSFTRIRAPFDGIIDRLEEREGSLLEEGAMLTTLSDNDVMWVYFNVPEARYLEYQEALRGSTGQGELDVELELANHTVFPQSGQIGAIEAVFNNETGNIAFRADFPNPDGLLRHGQTGTILIHHLQKDAVVIPQRAAYDILAKTYVYVVDAEGAVHQREIKVQSEQDDVFVIAEGLKADERIILEGLRQVRDGEHVECEFQDPEVVMSHLKFHAE